MNTLNIDHLSHSSVQKFVACPTSWAAEKAMGLRQPQGAAAAFGSHYEKLLAHGMGLPGVLTEYSDDSNRKNKCTEMEYLRKFSTPELQRAVTHYFKQKFAWKKAKDTQRPIEITPSQWEILATQYGADPELKLRLIGFLDFTRYTPESKSLTEALRPVEILDTKTSSADVWRQEWAIQLTLYALAIGAPRWTIHRYVHGLPHKLASRTVEMETTEARKLIRQVMDRTAYYTKLVHTVIQDPGLVEHLPRNPGYHCQWCPLKSDCVSGSAFDGGGLPGKFSWAKEDTTPKVLAPTTMEGLL